ncbi:hypothetical protein P168DRAFT_324604 [Aspergillus campestris IBT 28561]|uniref:Uncharacterized protein n=1 Tax=Aspergillus campestris (strain IBT 28561) TaxID=1392248 RepID=A0A2I1DBB1_ASPC2|nr:uncharacterized protein P168DRAFT_324604 [Aspergillus campestris IBT 28561]PKY07166.1 hypothetical protein P168DRAFT_324604 [Aspergillus campestris IBT 28561]
MPKRTLADRSPQQEAASVNADNVNTTASASPVPVPKGKKARAKAKKQDKAKAEETKANTVMGPPEPKRQDVKKECPKLALARLWAKKAADLEKPMNELQYSINPIPFKIGEDGKIHPAEPQTIPRYEGSVHSMPALTKDAIADILRKTKPDCPKAQAWIKAQEGSKLARERMQATMGDREDLRKKVVQKIRDQARLAAVHSGAPKHEIKNFLAGIPDRREEVTGQDENVHQGQGEGGPQGQDENGLQEQGGEDPKGHENAMEVDMEDDDEQKNASYDSDDDHRKKRGGKKERTLEERQLQRVIDAHEKFLVKMNEITSGLRNI